MIETLARVEGDDEPTVYRSVVTAGWPGKHPTTGMGDVAQDRPPRPAIVPRVNEINPGSDSVYKRLYSFPEMVADLLRSVLPASTVEALDLDSLEKVPAAYVGDDFHQRHGDTVWRVRAAGAEGGWAYVLVLLEFQSSSDATMALRVNEYTVMLYRELLRAKAGTLIRGARGASRSHDSGDLPPVLPVVLYNGESRWAAARDVYDLIVPTGPVLAPYQPSQRYLLLDARHAKADYAGKLTSALALLEQSGTLEELLEVVQLLADLLSPPSREELRRAFADWLPVLWGRRQSADEPVPPPDLTLEDVKMTLEERVARWSEPWVEQGIERGKRELLRRQVEVRFGAPTAERLFASLPHEDPQRLDAIAVAVVRCETADELLRQASDQTPSH